MKMLNLTGEISSFYQLFDQPIKDFIYQILTFDEFRIESKFYLILQKIQEYLNLDYEFFTIQTDIKNFLIQENVKYLVNPDINGCLNPINRTIYSLHKQGVKSVLNLTLMPLYYNLNLKNLSADYLILPIQKDLYFIFSNEVLKPPSINNIILLQVSLYYKLLEIKLYEEQKKIETIRENIINSLPYEIVKCRTKSPYYLIVIDLKKEELAYKLQLAMYVEDVLVDRRKSLIYIYIKKEIPKDTLIRLLNQKLKKLNIV